MFSLSSFLFPDLPLLIFKGGNFCTDAEILKTAVNLILSLPKVIISIFFLPFTVSLVGFSKKIGVSSTFIMHDISSKILVSFLFFIQLIKKLYVIFIKAPLFFGLNDSHV